MDSTAPEPRQSANVSLPVQLYHQMAACFYGDGPTYAQLMGYEPDDVDALGSGARSPDDDDSGDMDEEAVVAVPKFKVKSYGIREGTDGAS